MLTPPTAQASWTPKASSPKPKELPGTKQREDGSWQKSMGSPWIRKWTLKLHFDTAGPERTPRLWRKGGEEVSDRPSPAETPARPTPGLSSRGSGPAWLSLRTMACTGATVFLTQRCCSTQKTKDGVKSPVPPGWPETCPLQGRSLPPSHSPGETLPSVKCQGPQSQCTACPVHRLGSQPPQATPPVTYHSLRRLEPGKCWPTVTYIPSAASVSEIWGPQSSAKFWANYRNNDIDDFFSFSQCQHRFYQSRKLPSLKFINLVLGMFFFKRINWTGVMATHFQDLSSISHLPLTSVFSFVFLWSYPRLWSHCFCCCHLKSPSGRAPLTSFHWVSV